METLMSILLADLTPAQHEAVTHFEGPLLVIAGAGSGKTRVITRRVAWLLEQGVKPWSILAITFTNKAAGEMRQRVEALVSGNRVWISTFHSLGARLLRRHAEQLGLDTKFTIYDQGDRIKMVKNALESANIDHVRFTPETIQGAISKAKNQLLTPDKYALEATDFFTQTVARVYPVYEKLMRDANALDFDDLLLWLALAMKSRPELRAELDARFRFVLIDEYQDTNKAQYQIARGLSTDQPNLCVVGDPDQSIYRWRNADIRNILDFERDFPAARVITLERNYRSTQAILEAANSVIRHNRARKPKDLVTANGPGVPVRLVICETGRHEAETIAQQIREAVADGRRAYRDFAVFLRINALTRALEAAFVSQRIPFQIVRGLAFYERKENKDVLAYLRLLLNSRDDLSFLRVVNEPARGVGRVSLDHLRAYAVPRAMSLLAAALEVQKIPAIKGKAHAGLRNFAALIFELQKHLDTQPDELLRLVIERSGYSAMLRLSGDPDDAERLANIEELITAAGQFAAEDSSGTIADFLESITLASDVDGWDEKQDCVSVMTLHAAKGLEFPVIYMIAVEQGLLPHQRSLSEEEEVEEERRLCFVGMTRAKEELNLCHTRLREFRGQTLYVVPSMFLSELPAEGIETTDLSAHSSAQAMPTWRSGPASADAGWAEAGIPLRTRSAVRDEIGQQTSDIGQDFVEGMLVKHEAYGTGRVVGVGGFGAMRTVKIRFQQAGERSFRVAKAKLTIVRS
jgi:DNA helicase II / ATP-dependent DNA helicase PcrA